MMNQSQISGADSSTVGTRHTQVTGSEVDMG